MHTLQVSSTLFLFFPKVLTEIFSPIKLCMAYSNHETLLVTSDYRYVSESQSSEHILHFMRICEFHGSSENLEISLPFL